MRQPFLLAWTEHPSCPVIGLQRRDMQRVYRLNDFNKVQLIQPNVAFCAADRVNNDDRLYLVIDSARPDTKHAGCSTVPDPADGAGGSAIV